MKDLPLLDHRAIVDPSIDAMIEPHVEATDPSNPAAVADPNPEVAAEPELEPAAVPSPEATDEPSYRVIVSISQILLSDGCAVSVLAGPRGEIYVVAQGGLDGSTRIELGPFAPDASDF